MPPPAWLRSQIYLATQLDRQAQPPQGKEKVGSRKFRAGNCRFRQRVTLRGASPPRYAVGQARSKVLQSQTWKSDMLADILEMNIISLK